MQRKKVIEGVDTNEDMEKVLTIPLKDLRYFKDNPFKVRDDDAMIETVESIKEYGVLVPAIARPCQSGGYELISGHRRRRACELAEIFSMPTIVRNLTDDEAIIIMIDSNLQRENILPSERAFAYKMKLAAIKRQGERTDLTSRQSVGKLETADIIGEKIGDSGRQVQRYIRLTELVPELLEMVDNKNLGFTTAVELSYLNKEEQVVLLDVIDAEQAIPSFSQAQRMKKLFNEGLCDFDNLSNILREEKKGEIDKISIPTGRIKKYFPKSYSPKKMEEQIIKLLEGWHKKRSQNQER